MRTIKSKENGTIIVKDTMACGDILISTEHIDNAEYNIYVGFNGYPYYYAVEKRG